MNHKTGYNPFHQIYQGLCTMLYYCSLAIQHNDFSDDTAAATTIGSLKELIWLFEGHAHTEDTKVFGLIQKIVPDIIDDF